MKKFCDKLIQLRREKGYSQEQLAEYLEVSRQSVSKWEADKTMPEISKLIACLLYTSLRAVLFWGPEEVRKPTGQDAAR